MGKNRMMLERRSGAAESDGSSVFCKSQIVIHNFPTATMRGAPFRIPNENAWVPRSLGATRIVSDSEWIRNRIYRFMIMLMINFKINLLTKGSMFGASLSSNVCLQNRRFKFCSITESRQLIGANRFLSALELDGLRWCRPSLKSG